jgi:glycine cleavage system H protein
MAQERFTKDHEYIRLDGDIAVVGITRHAAEQLGDVVFVEVPELGRKLKAGEAAGVVESVKAASDVYSPVGGEVAEANGELAANPQWVNEEPEGKAWFFKLRIGDKSELDKLMDRAAYDAFVKESA